ncbi:hypothetical protein BDZ45DRAFT_682263 [Acephala macrosclerotiorum]|nr:hypothetical protein BDZ45DRAFT_682263 [Acephala macrosclerotiorum]
MGMLMRLAIFSKCDSPESIHAPTSLDRAELASLLGFTELHLENPRWAVVEGSYAAGFGPVANLSAHPPFHDHATGNLGTRVKLMDQSRADLLVFLSEAKQHGCIGVIVEIVNNQSVGRVTTPDELRNLSEACRESGLILAIDETITALRCGAPFAHQRPEYKHSKPDIVFFGKALRAQGIGINFDGPYVSRLGIDTPSKKMQAVYDWQAVVTQALHLPVLIDAIGVLEMATAGDWVGRATIIGQHLRQIALKRAQSMKGDSDESESESETKIIGGLDSFIFVHKHVAATFLIMGAFSAGSRVSWVRWLPRMDRHFTDRAALESIMSGYGGQKRNEISKCLENEGLRPQWCFYCGTWARGTAYPWCRTCCIDACDAEECVQQLLTHKCLG